MGAVKRVAFEPSILHDRDGQPIDSTVSGGLRRLAVDIGGASVVVGGFELDDGGGGTTRAQVHEDGTAFNASPNSGSILVGGMDPSGPTHRHIRVDSQGRLVISPTGVFDQDTDSDLIAAGQTLALMITENYQFDGTNWRRLQGRGHSGAISEGEIHLLTRSAVAGLDTSAAAGSQNVPVEARNADGDDDFFAARTGLVVNARLSAFHNTASDFVRIRAEDDDGAIPEGMPSLLSVVGILYGYRSDAAPAAEWQRVQVELDDGSIPSGEVHLGAIAFGYAFDSVSWARVQSRAADGLIDESLPHILARAAVSGTNSSNAAGSRNDVVEARQFSTDADALDTLTGLLVNARGAVFSRETGGNWILTPARADDDSLPSDEVHPTGISLNYVFDGTSWVRQAAGSGGSLSSQITGVVQVQNTDTTPLAAGATRTETGRDLLNYREFSVSIFLQPGAGLTLDVTIRVEVSHDNVTWRTLETIEVGSASSDDIQVGADDTALFTRLYAVSRRYMRTVVLNNDLTNALAATEIITMQKP